MHLISWNCRGLGNPVKAEAVKYILKKEPSGILLLQETKIEEEALLSISKSKWNKNAGNIVSSRGTLGGLEMLWSEDKFLLKSSYANQHWIFIELQQASRKIFISLFNFHVPVNILEKKTVGTISLIIWILTLPQI